MVAGRAVSVGLITLFTGVTLSALDVDRTPIQLSPDTSARAEATLRYSSGFSVRVQAAAAWSSLDTLVADVSAAGWITPRQEGSARIVASIGRFADTATVLVTNQGLQSQQPRPAEAFVESIGVNVHLSYFDRVYGSGFRSIIIPRLQELGVRHLRDGGTTLPNEDWMAEVYGRWREAAEATGAKFTVIMSPRRTASGPGTDYGDVTHIGELRNRIGAEHIAAWEGVNEHDLSGRPNWANEVRTLQRAMYAFVKGDPDLARQHRVIGPSLANLATASQVGDLSAYMDEGAIHPYDGGQVPTTNLLANVNGVRPISGDKALQATEVGYHTAYASSNPWHWALSESAHAKYTLRQFLELFNAGVRRSFAYELIDEGTDPTDMEQNFGLLRNDGSAKPAFDGLRNLIALLGDRGAPAFSTRPLRVQFSGDTAGVRRLLLQKADGRRYLVLWQNSLSYDKATRQDLAGAARTLELAFDEPIATSNVYVPLGGMKATATYRDARTLTLSIPDHPIVLEMVN